LKVARAPEMVVVKLLSNTMIPIPVKLVVLQQIDQSHTSGGKNQWGAPCLW
jgi:hypothetical protein